MSTATWGYGVDLDDLAGAIGSGDQALVDKLQESIEPSELFDRPGEPTVRDGLGALITGNLLEDYVGRAKQLYALEILCQHFGRRLDGQEHIAYLDDLGWDTPLIGSGPPLGLPRADDFPDVAHLTAEAVQQEYARLADLDSEDDDPDVEEGREELVGWLQQCSGAGSALVTFQY